MQQFYSEINQTKNKVAIERLNSALKFKKKNAKGQYSQKHMLDTRLLNSYSAQNLDVVDLSN